MPPKKQEKVTSLTQKDQVWKHQNIYIFQYILACFTHVWYIKMNVLRKIIVLPFILLNTIRQKPTPERPGMQMSKHLDFSIR